MNFSWVEPFAIGKLDFDEPTFTNDMQAGSDQAVAGDYKARSNSIFFALAIKVRDDDHRLLDLVCQRLDRQRRCFGFSPSLASRTFRASRASISGSTAESRQPECEQCAGRAAGGS